MNRSLMYLRPGNFLKQFIVEEYVSGIDKTGRPKVSYTKDGMKMLKGVLAEATPEQTERFKQLAHPISHTIVQRGRPKAKAEDKLILGNRVFLIQGIDEPGSVGVCTLYYVEERFDIV